MPESYILQKTSAVGTLYRAEVDKAYVIKRVGTDSTGKAAIKVAGAVAAEFNSEVAPLAKTTSNVLGPLDLDPLYVVVPQGKPLEFTGDSGSKVKLIGTIIELAPGEALPTPFMARAGVQAKEYITYQRGTYSHGTDTAWAADDERTILDFTCPVGEKHVFKRFAGVNIANLAAALGAGQFGVRIYVDDKPYDIIETEMGRLGIDAYEAALPPRDALTLDIFGLAQMPIELAAGRNLKVKLINVSGAAISPSTGASIDVTVNLVDEKTVL